MYKKHALQCLFFYPALFSLTYNLITGMEWVLADFFENVLSIAIVVIICFSISIFTLRLFAQITCYLLITLTILVETSYYYVYKSVITMSTLYIFFETNTTEASEYLIMYINYFIVIILFLLVPLIVIVLLLFKWNKVVIAKKRLSLVKSLGLSSIAIIALLVIMGMTKVHKYNLVYTTSKAYFQYQKEMEGYDKLGFHPKGGKYTDVEHPYPYKELYVLVIGESVNRNHLSLYGYSRKTNPKLEEIKDELIIYEDIISPFANTIESLPKILTYGNHENPDAKFNGVIMQLFNKAGFETYWLSNQAPLGMHESYITKIAKACDKRYFQNTISNKSSATYDEILLKPFKDILNDPAEKKLVIVHLLGSHVDYSKRYPKNYEVFSGAIETVFPSPRAYRTINAYDNSILYSDFIVREIIDMVKLSNSRSFVLYFSDHAEDVYKTSNKSYHAQGIKSKHMYEIPFILWTSEKFRQTADSLVLDIERPFMTDDLFYGISDLAGINYKEFEPERSLFNKSFIQYKRLIINDLDYDSEFKNR